MKVIAGSALKITFEIIFIFQKKAFLCTELTVNSFQRDYFFGVK